MIASRAVCMMYDGKPTFVAPTLDIQCFIRLVHFINLHQRNIANVRIFNLRHSFQVGRLITLIYIATNATD